MNKRQKRNRKILKIIIGGLLLLQLFLSFGIVGNIEKNVMISKTIIVLYIINTIILFGLIKLANYIEL